MFISQWVDVWLGDYGDELGGCDSLLSLGFSYNAKSPDEAYRHLGGQSPAIGYQLLSVFDMLRRRVRTLVATHRAPGTYSVVWDGRDDLGNALPSGVSVYRLLVGHIALLRSMVLLR